MNDHLTEFTDLLWEAADTVFEADEHEVNRADLESVRTSCKLQADKLAVVKRLVAYAKEHGDTVIALLEQALAEEALALPVPVRTPLG